MKTNRRQFLQTSAAANDSEQRRMAVYAAIIERMDRGIGRMLARLDEHGIAGNTLVMSMSDNGGNFEETCKLRQFS